MKTALVTGASGFAGQHLVRRLRLDGWAVRTVSRRACEGFADHVPLDLAKDRLDPALIDGIDTVFYLAAWQPGTGDPRDAERINAGAAAELAELAKAGCVRRYIYISSTAAMGNALGSPLNETAACRPSSLYERSKRDGELAVSAVEGLSSIILRPPMISGPGLQGGPLLKMLKLCSKGRFPIFGGLSDMAKPLVYIDDLVDAMVLAAESKLERGTFLITSGEPHRLHEILQVCGAFTGRSRPSLAIPLSIAKIAALVSTPLFQVFGKESPLSNARLEMFLADRHFDITAARRDLGYKPSYQATQDILLPAFKWFRQQGLI